LRLFAVFNSKTLTLPIEVEIEDLVAEDMTYFTSCYLPSEVLKKEGKFTLGIYGYILNEDESLKKRLSLKPIECTVVKGSYEEETEGAEVPDPTVFEIYFNKIAQYEERIEALFDNANESLKKIKHFNSVADMKADTTLEETYYVKTLGYYEANDGGGADYLIRATQETDVEDGGSIHFISNGLVAELITNKPFVINPEQILGETDLEKLQNAINYACEINNNIPVTIELNRIYNVDVSLTIDKPLNRAKLTLNGLNGGGIRKTTQGELFITTKSYVSDIDFSNMIFISNDTNGLIIMNSPKFINIYFNHCTFTNVDTAIYSETYLQSISFKNCLITGGSGDFINVAGAYYLNIDNCVIEHRKAGFLINQIDSSILYNRMFFVTITNNLIEGFSETEGGFVNLYRIHDFSVCNNYFESLYRTIQLNGVYTYGQLNIENNRLYIGTNYPQETGGFVYINPDSGGIFRVPTISFKGNMIENTYAFFFNKEEFDNYTTISKINYDNNRIDNTFTGAYTYKDSNTNLPFNIFPLIKITDDGATSKYQRQHILVTADRFTLEDTIKVGGITYEFYLTNYNYQYIASTKATITTVATAHEINDFYLGIDVYADDIVSATSINPYVNILNYARHGNINNKCLKISTTAQAEQKNVVFNVSAILCGLRG
jgi:hypothetical protein